MRRALPWLLLSVFGGLLVCGVVWVGEATRPPVVVGTLERPCLRLGAGCTQPVVELLVRAGQRVESDQPLVRLDDALLRARLGGAEAELATRCALLAQLLRGAPAAALAEARAGVADAEVECLRASLDLHEAEQAVSDGDSGRLLLPQALSDAAEARRQARQARLRQLEQAPRAEAVAEAWLGLARAEAEVRALRLRLERLVVRAPCPGSVLRVCLRPGERASALAPLVLLEVEPPVVRARLPAALQGRVCPGAAAVVDVVGREEALAGWVRAVDQDRVEVELIEDRARQLPGGTSARIRFLPPAEHDPRSS